MIFHELPVAGDKVGLDQQEPRLISSLEASRPSEEAASRSGPGTGPGTGGFSPDKSPHSRCVNQSVTESDSESVSQSDSQSPSMVEGKRRGGKWEILLTCPPESNHQPDFPQNWNSGVEENKRAVSQESRDSSPMDEDRWRTRGRSSVSV